MNVYLIRTPGYAVKEFNEVCDFLTPFGGLMKFCSPNFTFSEAEFPVLASGIREHSPDQQLTMKRRSLMWEREERGDFLRDPNRQPTFEELFSLCKAFRRQKMVNNCDYVVLLTKWGNEFNFLSSFDAENNIFVQADNWDTATQGVSPKYPLAYQIVENIIQSSMNLGINLHHFLGHLAYKEERMMQETDMPQYTLKKLPDYSPFVHEETKGCINDFCLRRSDIMIKIQTANICPFCTKKILGEENGPNLLWQTADIFVAIRSEYMYKIEEPNNLSNSSPFPIIVDKKGRITLQTGTNEIELRLDHLEKTVYIFYLTNWQGVKNDELPHRQDSLLDLYCKLRNSSPSNARDAINSLACDGGKYMSTIRTNIKKKILGTLSPTIAEPYLIKGKRGDTFGIAISRLGLATIDSRF